MRSDHRRPVPSATPHGAREAAQRRPQQDDTARRELDGQGSPQRRVRGLAKAAKRGHGRRRREADDETGDLDACLPG